MTSRRRNLWLPDALWDAVNQAALNESVEHGHRVSQSEWIRDAMLKKLAMERSVQDEG